MSAEKPPSAGISLFESVLVDIGDNYAPPRDVLRVSVIGDSVALTVAQFEEDNKRSVYTTVAEITVDLHTLIHLLHVARNDEQRADYRPKDDPCYRGLNRAWTQTT